MAAMKRCWWWPKKYFVCLFCLAWRWRMMAENLHWILCGVFFGNLLENTFLTLLRWNYVSNEIEHFPPKLFTLRPPTHEVCFEFSFLPPSHDRRWSSVHRVGTRGRDDDVFPLHAASHIIDKQSESVSQAECEPLKIIFSSNYIEIIQKHTHARDLSFPRWGKLWEWTTTTTTTKMWCDANVEWKYQKISSQLNKHTIENGKMWFKIRIHLSYTSRAFTSEKCEMIQIHLTSSCLDSEALEIFMTVAGGGGRNIWLKWNSSRLWMEIWFVSHIASSSPLLKHPKSTLDSMADDAHITRPIRLWKRKFFFIHFSHLALLIFNGWKLHYGAEWDEFFQLANKTPKQRQPFRKWKK